MQRPTSRFSTSRFSICFHFCLATLVALYWYGSLDEPKIKALRAGPFREPAEPHWITSPTACTRMHVAIE